jgi:hypothetical protein
MLSKLSLLALTAMLLATPGFAQNHSAFNGKWALSQGRSDFGGGDALIRCTVGFSGYATNVEKI